MTYGWLTGRCRDEARALILSGDARTRSCRDSLLHVDVPDFGRLIARSHGDPSCDPGEIVGLPPRRERLHRFDTSGVAMKQKPTELLDHSPGISLE